MQSRWNGRRALAGLSGAAAGALLLTFGPAVAASAAPTCVPAGPSGLTAAMLVTTGQTVSNQTVDGTGCDIGIYLAPGTNNVTLDTVTVSGANVHGIFGQDNDSVTIQNSTIQNNGLNPNSKINEQKAVELDGATNSVIKNNTVQNNFADGGIGIDDDGPNSAGAINGGSATPVKAANDVVSGNKLPNNYGGCDIVVAAYNAGGGLDRITVDSNTIPGKVGQFDPAHGPFIGQVVVANDFPNNAITNVTVSNNTIVGSALAGIVLHANAPGDTESGVTIMGNTLSDNHWLTPFGPPQTTGIAVQAEGGPPGAVPYIDNTLIQGDTITNEYYGIWTKGQVTNLRINDGFGAGVVQEFFRKPDAFRGYTLAGADGGALTYGNALYAGNAIAARPQAPIVGIAPTRDNGGYWMAGADGGIFSSGDASYLGSLPGLGTKPTAPIVGITPTHPGGSGGDGFFLVGSDGKAYAFGDASLPSGVSAPRGLAAPIVGIAATPDDGGYWLVGADGGVITAGDAGFFGSMGGQRLVAPVVGIIGSPTGNGYTLVARDGGVFTFGDAKFYGSLSGTAIAPVVGIAAGPSGPFTGQPGPMGPPPTPSGGYAILTLNGGVYTFGNAGFFGSAAGTRLGGPSVGFTYTR